MNKSQIILFTSYYQSSQHLQNVKSPKTKVDDITRLFMQAWDQHRVHLIPML